MVWKDGQRYKLNVVSIKKLLEQKSQNSESQQNTTKFVVKQYDFENITQYLSEYSRIILSLGFAAMILFNRQKNPLTNQIMNIGQTVQHKATKFNK